MTCTGRDLNSRGLKLRLRTSGAFLPSPIRLYDVHRERFKQPGREAEVRNEWSRVFTPPYAFMACTERVSLSFLFTMSVGASLKMMKAALISRQFNYVSKYCTLQYAVPICRINFFKVINPKTKTSAVRDVSGRKSFSLISLLHVSARPLPYSVATPKVPSGYPSALYLRH
jgi:hypothetical protein